MSFCCFCNTRLKPEEIFTHVCTTRVAKPKLSADIIYDRLLRSVENPQLPLISLQAAYGDTDKDDGRQTLDDLGIALSGLITGAPLRSRTQSRVLEATEAVAFSEMMSLVLKRVASPKNRTLQNTVRPPYAHRLLAAAFREALEENEQRAIALIAALTAGSDTPSLDTPVNQWIAMSTLPRTEDYAAEDKLRTELRSLPFSLNNRHDGDVMRERKLLWRDKDDFDITILYTILLQQQRESYQYVSLPPISATRGQRRWIDELIGAAAFGITDARRAVDAASQWVNENPRRAFACTRIARAVDVARSMVSLGECDKCGQFLPSDGVVVCGERNLCKMCFESSVHAMDPKQSGEAYMMTLNMHPFQISTETAKVLENKIVRWQTLTEHEAKFHCPLNAIHQTPFVIPMPLNAEDPRKPVPATCTECHITWCTQCSLAHHPLAANCAQVISAKQQWRNISADMAATAKLVLDELEEEKRLVSQGRAGIAAAVRNRQTLLETRKSRLLAEIDQLKNSIAGVHANNTAMLNWDNDGGSPKVRGARRCPKCGRQPILRVRACNHIVCGRNTNGENYQGGCLTKFDYGRTDAAVLYHPESTKKQEQERDRLLESVAEIDRALLAAGNGALENPMLDEKWPGKSCSCCKGKLLGPFYVHCLHCEPEFTLCINCVQHSKQDSHWSKDHSGHVLTTRKDV